MKIIVTGNQFEAIHEPAEQEFSSLLQRVSLTVEIWNRDNPEDQRQVIQSDVWPLPEPEPLPPE